MSAGDHASGPPAGTLAALVAQTTGSSPLNCYQCGRCAAGCAQNVPGEMDISPTRMMHLLQLEAAFVHEAEQAQAYASQALASDTPWLCAGCLACTTRCPQNVDIAGAMDVLRQEALRRGIASNTQRARDVQTLHKVFLDAAMKKGRIHELSLVMNYKLRTGHLFQDALLALPMYLKGKLHIAPPQAPDTAQVRTAVERLSQEGAAK